jgi:hypothetical protein
MGFNESLLLVIADKLLIGVILLIAGSVLNKRLEKFKGQIALQNVIAPSRLQAFTGLWNLTRSLTPRGKDLLPTEQDCASTFNELRKWYYSEGGAMHLAFESSDLCLKLLNATEAKNCSSAKELATSLRTQLKVDLGLYSKKQAGMRLPTID